MSPRRPPLFGRGLVQVPDLLHGAAWKRSSSLSGSRGSPSVTHACPYRAASLMPRGPVAATSRTAVSRTLEQPGRLRASWAR